MSKSSDADLENSEPQVWLDFSLACGYITEQEWHALDLKALEVGSLVNHMVNNPEKYQRRNKLKA